MFYLYLFQTVTVSSALPKVHRNSDSNYGTPAGAGNIYLMWSPCVVNETISFSALDNLDLLIRNVLRFKLSSTENLAKKSVFY